MNVLVTGGAGFIGSHLCERLAQDKDKNIYSLDNYFTGSEDNHINAKNITYINGSTENIFELLDGINIDMIYHLGEYSRVEQSFDDIDKVLAFNKNGALQVLEYVRKNNCKLLYAGSSTKYGDDGDNANASPYAWSKISNTVLVKNYGEWFGIDYCIAYFYNVYGPREIKKGKYATLIALFKQKYIDNEPMTVVSPGTQKRNFTHIDDTIDALMLIADKGYGDEYGIGTDESYTILEVAKMFNPNNIKMLDSRPGNRMDSLVISDKTKALQWSPKQSLKYYINDFLKSSVVTNILK